MYSRNKSILLCLGFFFLASQTSTIWAQEKHALKLYEAAIIAIDNKETEKANQLLEQAHTKDPQFVDPLLTLFQIHLEQKKFNKCIVYFDLAEKIDRSAIVPYLVKYATAYASIGNYQKAKLIIETEKLPEYLKEKAKTLITICDFALSQQINENSKVENLGDSINTVHAEYFPLMSMQDSIFLFMRRLSIQREDFYTSTLSSNGFSYAQPLSDNLNIASKKGSMSISADLKKLYYAGDYAEQGYGRYDLYQVDKTNSGWSKPKNLGGKINTEFWESAPSIAPDGNAIYFASNRPDGYGGIDIYVAYKNEKGVWEEAMNIGPPINTAGDDQTPFIHSDNKSLYFSSNGRIGYGGSDLYMSRKQLNEKWSTPINLGYPINTYDNEGSISVANNGIEAYIASDRIDSRGELDIYKVTLPENARAFKTLYFKGQLVDAVSKKGIHGNLQIMDSATGFLYTSIPIDSSGYFILALPYFDRIGLKITSPQYDYLTSSFGVEDIQSYAGKTVTFNLTKIENTFSKIFNNVFFETGTAVLNSTASFELDGLYSYLATTMDATILIEGHTDNTGNELQNIQLSQKRANAIANYLSQKGIAKNRISTIGYGSAKPIEDNATASGRAKNRRTSFTIQLNK